LPRARYRWDTTQKKLVPITDEWTPTARQGPRVDLYMDGIAAPDGTDISSKRKRREYMKRNNLADTSDYTQTWAAAERARREGTPQERKERREDVSRAAYEVLDRRR
jgi:hypothetical protein